MLQILREIFDNIEQHSVYVKLCSTNESLELEVRDDGKAIDLETVEAGDSLGVADMRECARAAGGWLDIQPLFRGGTVVRLTIPEEAPVSVGQ